MGIGPTPWLLAILTAGWFGWQASRAGRNRILWGVGGAAFGLVVSTIVLGLGQAVSIPFSDHEHSVDQAEWTGTAIALIVVAGWVLTLSLHRHHQAVWRIIKPGPSPTERTVSDANPGNAPSGKPTSQRG